MDDMVNIELNIDEKHFKPIEAAAVLVGQTIEKFILSSSMEAARNLLMPPSLSMDVSLDDFNKMQETLDNPPEPNENLKRLMRSKSPWEAKPLP